MPDLIETVEDGVATLTLNRPESLNALSEGMRRGLLEVVGLIPQRFASDKWIPCPLVA